MVESYKIKSKLATAIGGIATIISVLGVDQLQALFPTFGKYIPAIVALATWYISGHTEDIRVAKAEQIVHEEYAQQDEPKAEPEPEPENVVVNLTLDGEDVIKEDEVEEEPDINDGGC